MLNEIGFILAIFIQIHNSRYRVHPGRFFQKRHPRFSSSNIVRSAGYNFVFKAVLYRAIVPGPILKPESIVDIIHYIRIISVCFLMCERQSGPKIYFREQVKIKLWRIHIHMLKNMVGAGAKVEIKLRM